MESEAINWEQDLPLDADEAYRSLVRSLRRTDGFALLFVRCSPVQGDQIITDVRTDLPSKTIEVLELKESIDNLYDYVDVLPNHDQVNVLFVKGIEYSIFAYEDREMNDINLRSQSSVYGGTWQGIPRILGHLNLSRERFRDNFKFCFVFLLPEFALRYFICRAPDFFDWRSNIYEFPTEKYLLVNESFRLIEDNDWDKYISLSNQERNKKMLEILAYLEEEYQSKDSKAALFREYGRLISIDNHKSDEALAYCNKALVISPNYPEALCSKGFILLNLGRYNEALICCNQALEIKPDYYEAWNNKGVALCNMDRHEEAIVSYNEALKINNSYEKAWSNRGISQFNLGRYEEAFASFDKITCISPNYYEAWNNRGIVQFNLGRYKEAFSSFDNAVKINPDYHEAWINRAISLKHQGLYEEALLSYNRALKIKYDYTDAWANRGFILSTLGRDSEAIESYQKFLEIGVNS